MRAGSSAGTSEPAAWEAQDAAGTVRDGAAGQVFFRNNMTMCHIPQVSRCCRWQAVSRAILGRWQRGKGTRSPARCSGRKRDRGWSFCALGEEQTEPWGAGRSCAHPPALPEKVIPGGTAFPWSFPWAGIVHPVPAGARDRALPVGCHLSASPGASGTDPGPLPAGTLLCSDPAMHSKSAAGKERAKLLFWPGMC